MRLKVSIIFLLISILPLVARGYDLNINAPVSVDTLIHDLASYCNRIKKEHKGAYDYFTSNSFEWNIPTGLAHKINTDGTFRPFFGSTVVFDLTDSEKNKILKVQDYLRSKLDFLASPLSKEQFHITLHDLFNSSVESEIATQLANSEKLADELFNVIKKTINLSSDERYITLKANKIIPSVNTSMVIGYTPSEESDFRKLFNLAQLFDNIVVINYFLRPHVTLDYFIPTNLTVKQKEAFRAAIIDVNNMELPNIKLDITKLAYQLFYTMDDYRTRISLD